MNTHVDSNNTKELKSFALTMMWAIPVLFIVIFPWMFDSLVRWQVLWFSLLLGILYLFYPKGIYPFYRVWMSIAGVLGWINTRLLLGLVFYCMILPIGFLLRTLGKLHYHANLNKNNSSYWIKTTNKLDNDDLERPF
ncbi:MAG: hypothetical protein ACI9IA_001270 [Enterobacterales bacterium]|jgi:hypothetical protein